MDDKSWLDVEWGSSVDEKKPLSDAESDEDGRLVQCFGCHALGWTRLSLKHGWIRRVNGMTGAYNWWCPICKNKTFQR